MIESLYTFAGRQFWRRQKPKLSKLSQHFFFDLVRELSDSIKTINGKFLEGCDLSKFSVQHIALRFCTIGSVIPPKRNYPEMAVIRKKNKLMSVLRKHRLCGLVVIGSGYRSRGPGFDSRRYQIFWEVVGLERGPLSLVRTTEELLEWKSSSSGLENRN
jgi:hypothetical protein